MVDMMRLIRQERIRLQGSGASPADAKAADAAEDALEKRGVPQQAAQCKSHRCLADGRVGAEGLDAVYYVGDFITHAEANLIVTVLDSQRYVNRWTGSKRRHLNLGGRPSEREVVEPLPRFAVVLIDRLMQYGVFPPGLRPNHVLVNDYRGRGQCVPHTDGPLYSPRVAVISIMGPAQIELWGDLETAMARSAAPIATLVLQSGSLQVLADYCYSGMYHGFPGDEDFCVHEHCINTQAAGVAVGERLRRSKRRVSLVFVHKLGA